MSLSKKYAISEETIKKMVRDGVISCSWAGRESVYKCYLKHKATAVAKRSDGNGARQAVIATAAEMNCSLSHVWESIQHFER